MATEDHGPRGWTITWTATGGDPMATTAPEPLNPPLVAEADLFPPMLSSDDGPSFPSGGGGGGGVGWPKPVSQRGKPC